MFWKLSQVSHHTTCAYDTKHVSENQSQSSSASSSSSSSSSSEIVVGNTHALKHRKQLFKPMSFSQNVGISNNPPFLDRKSFADWAPDNLRQFVQDNDSDDEDCEEEDYQCGNGEVKIIIILFIIVISNVIMCIIMIVNITMFIIVATMMVKLEYRWSTN